MNKEVALLNVIFSSILTLVITFLPYLILGENSYIKIHDILDSELVYLKILKSNNLLFSLDSGAEVPNILNGIRRSFFHSEFSLIRLMFYFLPPFWAYILNSFIVRTVGVIGISLLSFKIMKSEDTYNLILISILALSFGLLPVYTLYGLSLLGIPLLMWSFLSLYKRENLMASFLFVAIFPFYSHIAMTTPFLHSLLLLFGIYKRIPFASNYWKGFVLLGVLTLIANHQALYSYFFLEIQSHRSQWDITVNEMPAYIRRFLDISTKSLPHSSRIFTYSSFLLIFFSIAIKSEFKKYQFRILLVLLALNLFYAFYEFLVYPLKDDISIFKTFQFGRYVFIVPFIHYLVHIYGIADRRINKWIMGGIVIIFCLKNISYNNSLANNFNRLFNENKSLSYSYRSFYSKDLFLKIKEHIGRPFKEYRVVSLGIHPAVSQYNGFYTLDAYMNNYPLSYKKEFREVLSPEIDKDPVLKEYYDKWGNRCYLFSSELFNTCRTNCTKISNEEVHNLEINASILKSMGADYIISAVPINNFRYLDMILDRVFMDDISIYKIYLYRLNG